MSTLNSLDEGLKNQLSNLVKNIRSNIALMLSQTQIPPAEFSESVFNEIIEKIHEQLDEMMAISGAEQVILCCKTTRELEFTTSTFISKKQNRMNTDAEKADGERLLNEFHNDCKAIMKGLGVGAVRTSYARGRGRGNFSRDSRHLSDAPTSDLKKKNDSEILQFSSTILKSSSSPSSMNKKKTPENSPKDSPIQIHSPITKVKSIGNTVRHSAVVQTNSVPAGHSPPNIFTILGNNTKIVPLLGNSSPPMISKSSSVHSSPNIPTFKIETGKESTSENGVQPAEKKHFQPKGNLLFRRSSSESNKL